MHDPDASQDASSSQVVSLGQRLQAGEESALALLFDHYRERLRGMIQFRMDARLGQRLSAEDVLQEGFLAAAKRIRHFGESQFRSPFLWLRLICNQTLIDLHRQHLGSKRRDAKREVSLDIAGPVDTSMCMAVQLVGDATSPTAAAVREEQTQLIHQALASLEPIDQEIVALRHFEELTNAEVAELLKLSVKAASIRYVRAIKRLKDALSQIPGFFS